MCTACALRMHIPTRCRRSCSALPRLKTRSPTQAPRRCSLRRCARRGARARTCAGSPPKPLAPPPSPPRPTPRPSSLLRLRPHLMHPPRPRRTRRALRAGLQRARPRRAHSAAARRPRLPCRRWPHEHPPAHGRRCGAGEPAAERSGLAALAVTTRKFKFWCCVLISPLSHPPLQQGQRPCHPIYRRP